VKRSDFELRRLKRDGVPSFKDGRLQTPGSFYDDRSKYGEVKHAAYVFRGREGAVSRKAVRRVSVTYW
jgi:hypothetical protein